MADEIIEASRLLVSHGLNTLSSGNISAKCKDWIILTPSGIGKHSLKRKDLVFYDVGRNIFLGYKKQTTEYKLHLEVYRTNNNVNSVVHAHNPLSLAILEKVDDKSNPFEKVSLVEAEYVLGRVCISHPHPPGTLELAESVASLSKDCDIVVIPRHGAVSFDKSPLLATERLFALEYVAYFLLNKNKH